MSETDILFENADKQQKLLKFTYVCNNHSIKFLNLEIFTGDHFKNTALRPGMLYKENQTILISSYNIKKNHKH